MSMHQRPTVLNCKYKKILIGLLREVENRCGCPLKEHVCADLFAHVSPVNVVTQRAFAFSANRNIFANSCNPCMHAFYHLLRNNKKTHSSPIPCCPTRLAENTYRIIGIRFNQAAACRWRAISSAHFLLDIRARARCVHTSFKIRSSALSGSECAAARERCACVRLVSCE